MGTRDIIAQLRQDITTASDAGDESTARRLREELSKALEESGDRSADSNGQ
ncbi:hypothetical protein ACIO14_28715 [Nocardia fluminea]|uniref:hypothetical protein n=1 Tax=Nocardia fluminea TaxID=134984 RepID=UPI00382B8652